MITLRYICLSKAFYLIVLVTLIAACDYYSEKRFEVLKQEDTGIDFVNNLEETPELNIFNYLYFYDGAGVAAGDLNGDGLPDLFFTANQGQNKLFLNKSDFKFEDVTEQAFDTEVDDWTTGVTFVDINNDGKLDIYVSNVGDYLKLRGVNKLFVNQGNNENGVPVFEEMAEEYGLDLVGFSTQAAFFDYDLDGDLDMFMMNHSVHSNATFDYSKIRNESHPLAGDKLLRNDNGKFVEVTEEAGIYNSALGYGLGIGISDINQDGYPDIYIGNDFHEDDYLYINNGDGTFTESLGQMIQHTSRSSMGNDLIDINNDGLIDIFSLDMLPSDYEMLKASAAEDPLEIYNTKLKYGYKHQFSRNTLQLNRGNNKFSEIGLLADVYATDWSWAALGADFNNNGHVDLFVSNGIKGRTNNLDYISYISQDQIQNRLEGKISKEELKLTDRMPVVKVPNYMYKNDGTLFFENVSNEWGIDQNTFSSGAAYVDLDGDGDLDIVLNNVDQQAMVLKNNSREKFDNTNYLNIDLNGPDGNRFGIGTKITIPLDDDKQIFRELYPVRGYLSSVDYTVHVGLDSLKTVPELHVQWPDGKTEVITNVSANQTVTVDYANAVETDEPMSDAEDNNESLFSEITDKLNISYKHEENDFIEFNREVLIPHMVSREGPAIAVGDVNGDGLDDFFAGGAKRQASKLFIQQQGGIFEERKNVSFENDNVYEDVDAVFVDVDGDNDQDLIVVSGGNEYYGRSEYMRPRLYLNDGKGNFVRDTDGFPDIYLTGSVVSAADVDNDGDTDLFIGARTKPWQYGVPPTSYLLINEGGAFRVDESSFGKKFADLGLVTDAKWADMNGDGYRDLVVASEWSDIKIVYNQSEKEDPVKIPATSGLWNTISVSDFNNDGNKDIAAGNLGLNSKFKASEEKPVRMYVNNFDESGRIEQIITYIDDEGKERLFATKDELGDQLDYLYKKFDSYESFAQASLTEVIDPDLLESARQYSLNELQSSLFYNRGEGNFEKAPLPVTNQFSPIHDLLIYDFNEDGYSDLLAVGNFFEANIQRGRYDASYGNLLLNNQNDAMVDIPNKEINWYLEGQIRDIEFIKINGMRVLMVAENDEPLRFYDLNEDLY